MHCGFLDCCKSKGFCVDSFFEFLNFNFVHCGLGTYPVFFFRGFNFLHHCQNGEKRGCGTSEVEFVFRDSHSRRVPFVSGLCSWLDRPRSPAVGAVMPPSGLASRLWTSEPVPPKNQQTLLRAFHSNYSCNFALPEEAQSCERPGRIPGNF